jgi:hypothetical protein
VIENTPLRNVLVCSYRLASLIGLAETTSQGQKIKIVPEAMLPQDWAYFFDSEGVRTDIHIESWPGDHDVP